MRAKVTPTTRERMMFYEKKDTRGEEAAAAAKHAIGESSSLFSETRSIVLLNRIFDISIINPLICLLLYNNCALVYYYATIMLEIFFLQFFIFYFVFWGCHKI